MLASTVRPSRSRDATPTHQASHHANCVNFSVGAPIDKRVRSTERDGSDGSMTDCMEEIPTKAVAVEDPDVRWAVVM